MPPTSKICTHPDQDAVKAAFASDASDRELAHRFGVSHVAIGRHLRQHVVGAMQATVAALDRGRANQQRADQLAAIEQGGPVAIAANLDFASQAAKLTRIEEHLERMAAASEAGGLRAVCGGVGCAAVLRHRDRFPACWHWRIR